MNISLDIGKLAPYLNQQVGDLGAREQWVATPLTGGQSNPTWHLRTPVRELVVRAKPGKAEHLLPSAHAIEREVLVQRALDPSSVPVPKILCHCEDEDIIGVSFYVMAHVQGRVLRDTTLAELPQTQRRQVHENAMAVLAQLHNIGLEQSGLSAYGRHEGYAARTIARWAKQYAATCAQPLPFMADWTTWLEKNIPPNRTDRRAVTLVHGDFRLENLMISNHGPEVVAVLDWELSTLGDPLSDLAYYCMAWHNPQGLLRGMGDVDLQHMGLPSEKDMVATYCKHAGVCPHEVMTHWSFYLGLNYFRLTAILQGVADRVAKGQTTNPSAQAIGALTPVVAQIGWAISQTTY